MLPEKLKEIRKEVGISQAKLAKLLVEKGIKEHCTASYISALENKQFSNIDLFVKICECFEIKVEVILYKKNWIGL
jgi:transcriptional regulator with XRE-family HTH domain